MVDIVGLYMDPPDNALVLCVDEKTQIQALDRTQPGLPLAPGRIGSRTHDYKRNGTAALFAAFNILTGESHWSRGETIPIQGVSRIPEAGRAANAKRQGLAYRAG